MTVRPGSGEQVAAAGANGPSTWDKVSNHAVWRHTIGRASCLVRILPYTVGTAWRFGILFFRTILGCTVGQIPCLRGSCVGLRECGKDLIRLGILVDRIGNSALGVVFAPAKRYHSIFEATVLAFSSKPMTTPADFERFKARVTRSPGQEPKEISLIKIWGNYCALRPQYHKQIIASGEIYKSDAANGFALIGTAIRPC